jgi:hypothetical protein
MSSIITTVFVVLLLVAIILLALDDANVFKRHTCEECPPINIVPKPINGGWSDWINASTCTGPCGALGMKNGSVFLESRSCNSPTPEYGGLQCIGENVKTAKCKCSPDYLPSPNHTWNCVINGESKGSFNSSSLLNNDVTNDQGGINWACNNWISSCGGSKCVGKEIS